MKIYKICDRIMHIKTINTLNNKHSFYLPPVRYKLSPLQHWCHHNFHSVQYYFLVRITTSTPTPTPNNQSLSKGNFIFFDWLFIFNRFSFFFWWFLSLFSLVIVWYVLSSKYSKEMNSTRKKKELVNIIYISLLWFHIAKVIPMKIKEEISSFLITK